ncbi:unnamed protein product [Cyprideis torosa]|uniref:Uncharacterized protein n=1 Tax=Cyprideis torosa TaxID=163714 RepID=A0A7R8W8V1_9CRUS|nr:unnamed protein product [Cyprideis torosa]CAG0883584.1 unnamed protein product [Cyprideis torosa]
MNREQVLHFSNDTQIHLGTSDRQQSLRYLKQFVRYLPLTFCWTNLAYTMRKLRKRGQQRQSMKLKAKFPNYKLFGTSNKLVKRIRSSLKAKQSAYGRPWAHKASVAKFGWKITTSNNYGKQHKLTCHDYIDKTVRDQGNDELQQQFVDGYESWRERNEFIHNEASGAGHCRRERATCGPFQTRVSCICVQDSCHLFKDHTMKTE